MICLVKTKKRSESFLGFFLGGCPELQNPKKTLRKTLKKRYRQLRKPVKVPLLARLIFLYMCAKP